MWLAFSSVFLFDSGKVLAGPRKLCAKFKLTPRLNAAECVPIIPSFLDLTQHRSKELKRPFDAVSKRGLRRAIEFSHCVLRG